jgi:predicted DsbA family dithiol-disulfide isomerase
MEAHKLIGLAQDQSRVVNALFRAYFEEAKDIGDPEVLADIAAQCGVQGWPEKAHDVSQLEEEVRAMGISAVPTFIFARRSGVSGAYPAETLAQAIREASRS